MKYFILTLLAVFACSTPVENESSQANTFDFYSNKTAESPDGMVASAHPLATRAGAIMLEKGGNAADAAVATAFALAVVEPSMSGLGGRQQIIVRKPDGRFAGIDATSQAPLNYDPEADPEATDGYPTIGIPGVVAGLTKLLEEHGTLPLATVMAPAIAYATDGYEVLPGQEKMYMMVRDVLAKYESTKMYYFKNDSMPYQAGDLYRNQELANTLKMIAEGGRDAFYKGKIARQIAEDMEQNGGYLTMETLASYEALTSDIVSGTYRGYDVQGLWLPSFGAITIEIMQILENLPMSEYKGAEWASATYQAIDLAYQDRRRQFQDGARDTILSKEYAAELASRINVKQNKLDNAAYNVPDSWNETFAHTTHVSTADKDGMVVSLTQSLGPIFGSKMAAPGLGFMYANTMGPYLGSIGPGVRAASHISPMIITKDDAPYLVVGCAGGARIISAIVSVISRKIDHQLSLADALSSPRVHPARDTIAMETHEGWGWDDKILTNLESFGFRVKGNSEVGRFGRIHAIEWDAKAKKWIGAADPDWQGTASGPQ
jgi:gamma-glutamyltranspeptidase/glutathione hydrolase